MKIFAIYCRVILDDKPDWFDDFRQKYDENIDPHITLKQPCYIGDNLAEEVKKKFTRLFEQFDYLKNRIEVIFEKINIEQESTGDYCVMIGANQNNMLIKMQTEIVKAFTEYDKFLEPELFAYEKNFRPHITIGRDINQNKIDGVIEIVGEECVCGGHIDEVVLSVVEEINDKDAKEKADITLVKLSGIGE